jgi:pyruvate/oxaloacetate carboxyltransferase
MPDPYHRSDRKDQDLFHESNSELAPRCCLEAIDWGVTTLHTAVAPLANGTFLPAAETILRKAKRLGYSEEAVRSP